MTTRKKDELVTVREAAAECRRNMETVRRWIWGGKLPAQKLGNQLFIKRADLASYCREIVIKPYEATEKLDFLERAKAIRNEIHARTGEVFDAGEMVRQMRDELMNKREIKTKAKPGAKADLIKKMRKLRQEIHTRVGNLDVDKTIEELREERLNELTRLR